MNAALNYHVSGEARNADQNTGGTALRVLLVYQMQKVASVSWMAMGRYHFASAEFVHVHYMATDHLKYLRAQLLVSGSSQTIQRPLLFRNLIRTGERSRTIVNEALLDGRPMIVITGMRDPVARSASLLFFFSDFYSRSEARFSWRDAANVDDMRRIFLELWEQVFDSGEPSDTFARVLRFYFGAYRIWFDQELRKVIGIDVRTPAFPAGPARRLLEQGQTQVLVYRTEDMVPGSAGHALLRADMEAVLGKPVSGFPVQNAGMFRKSRDLYREFLYEVRVPKRLLDCIYGDATVRYFYTEEELGAFRRRWLNGPAD